MRLALFILTTLTLSSCTQFQRGPAGVRSVPKMRGFSLDWPVDRAQLTQRFKPKGSDKHWGIDLAARRGSDIFAAHDGKVVYTGSGFSGYGKLIIIEYGDIWASFYSHLDAITVGQGEWVQQGQIIGKMGSTGRSTGPHLHFELRRKKKPVNPLAYLP